MIARFILAVALAAVTIAVSAQPSSDAGYAQTLAVRHGCMGCHGVDRKIVGPAFRDIAAKYRDDPRAFDKLADKVKHGGVGVWGQLPMPAHPRMSDAEVRTVLSWILGSAGSAPSR